MSSGRLSNLTREQRELYKQRMLSVLEELRADDMAPPFLDLPPRKGERV